MRDKDRIKCQKTTYIRVCPAAAELKTHSLVAVPAVTNAT